MTILLYALAALLLFIFFRVAIAAWQGAAAIRRFRQHHGREGKDLLLVYSNSPYWQEHVETRWLPRWGARAVVVNWSERSRWNGDEPEIVLFRSVAGSGEHNPIAIVVPPSGPVRVIRFWRAFKERKRGSSSALERAERQLESALESPSPA